MSLSEMWGNLTPSTKRIAMAGCALSVFVVFGSFVTYMDRSKARPKPVKTTDDTTVMMPARKNTDMESLATSATSANRRMQQLEIDRKTDMAGVKEQMKQLRELLNAQDGSHRELADLKARLEGLSKRVEDAPPSKPIQPVPARLPPIEKVLPRAAVGAPDPAPVGDADAAKTDTIKLVAPAVKLRVIGTSEGEKNEKVAPTSSSSSSSSEGSKPGGESARDLAERLRTKDAESAYLPMGSMIRGVLLNGMDAPTSGAAQKNPTPVLIRIKHEAIMPNRARYDIKECFVIASGFGVMSTERANLRTEGISCVREDGGVVETNLNGYVIGEDGKVGMRGRLVSKQGAVIAQSLIAGVLSGIGKSLMPTGITGINLNPGSIAQTQSFDVGTSMEAGMLGGTSSTLNQISKFYLDIAKEMVPVVEIDAGRPVIIVLTRGGSLRMNAPK